MDNDGKRSATLINVKRPDGRGKKMDTRKILDLPYKESLDNMVSTRMALAVEKKEDKAMKWNALKEMEDHRATYDERRSVMAKR
jgi:hypothetical protein